MIAAWWILALGADAARGAEAPSPADRPEVAEAALDGGDTLVVVADHRAPLVTVTLAFPVSAVSPWGRAHHLEQAWPLLLDDRDGTFRDRADALAAPVSLYADARGAFVSLSCLRDDLPEALTLLGDLLRSDGVDAAARTRRVREEGVAWRTNRKSPAWVQERAVRQLVYPPGHAARDGWDHRASVPGPAQVIATRDAVVATPGRFVGLAGDVALDDVVPLLDGLLPPAREAVQEGAVAWGPPTPLDDRHDVEVRLPRLTQAYVAWVADGPALWDADSPALAVASHALGGHFYSRLVVALRHEGGQTYAVSARGGRGLLPSPYVVSTFTRTDNLPMLQATLLATVARFREEGLTDDELAVARGNLLGRALLDVEAPDQVLSRRLTERLWGVPPGTLDQARTDAAAVAPDAVDALVRAFFAPERFRWVRVVPR